MAGFKDNYQKGTTPQYLGSGYKKGDILAMTEEDLPDDFDEEYLNDLLYALIDMTREIIPNLTHEDKAKLDKAQADLMEDKS